ncbi:hypothetical protein BDDG_09959 [Blastomyces dermatitidis ATCC 18188]|uniref:Uncharacterized protein n=1 Tax=Ajellomyces dermatitidis (strain ATCC 18188 / CBS 674.68) TaxID=653446 RepID=F2TUU5_AJEDA|nr:hypothetical protein BDDG_09959 [Blastomyces dermatitidis ATCC 18188]
MASHSHNKCHHSAHIRQFVSKSSHIDRSTSADDSKPNVKSLIENLKNAIMKELSVLYVSDSPALTTSVPATLTPVTPGFAISAFITRSPCFKEMLHRLDESHFSEKLL